MLALLAMLMLASGHLWADGAPLAFDQYQAGSAGGNVAGIISADCTAATYFANAGASVSCGEATVSNGMLQRRVFVSGGGAALDGTYIQFIMTETGSDGDASASPFSTARGNLYFTNEDFVKMNNRGTGIASKQTILDASFDTATKTEERFQNIVNYNIGWANGTTNPWVDIMQDLTQLRYLDALGDPADPGTATQAKELMNENVSILSDGAGPALDVFDDTRVEINQRMTMEDQRTVATPSPDGIQKFKHTRLTGKYTTTGTDASGGINGNPLLPGGTNGGNVGWNVNDAVVANWIGYEQLDTSFSNIFGFTSFENKDKTQPLVGSYTKRTSFLDPEAGGPAPTCPADTAGVIYYIYNGTDCDYYFQPTYPTSGDTPDGTTAVTSPGGWDSIIDATSGNPLFGHAEAMADVTTYGSSALTDYSVKDPVIIIPPSADPNYLPNSNNGPYTATVSSEPFQPVDADYNNWTVSNGVFTVSGCPGDACGDPVVNSDGMYQRMVIVSGVTYYQTILVDGAVTGDPTTADFTAGSLGYVNETFVKAGAGSGLAGRTHLAEQSGYNPDYTGGYIGTNTTTNDLPSDAGDFVQDVALNMGWANQGTVLNATTGNYEPAAAIALTQDIFVPDYNATNASPIKEHFSMETGTNQLDKRIEVTSSAATVFGATATDFPAPINFKSVTVSGGYQQTASTDYGDPFVADGVTWAVGDALQLSWVVGEYGVTPNVPNAKINATKITNRTANTSYGVTDIDTSPIGNGPAFWYTDPFLNTPNNYPAFP
jgi:hypothetical protein